MAIEEEADAGIPEWVVTFGDMMSLLLTFFIMLVSMSEMKKDEQFQAVVDSMRRRFGHDASMLALVPGRLQPRSSPFESMATMGRAQRADTMRGGDKVKAPVGENPRVQSIRPADQSIMGGVVQFPEMETALDASQNGQLEIAVEALRGKPQKIEIRGHTTRRPIVAAADGAQDIPRDHWDLAYARCRMVMRFLVDQGIDPRRIRLGVAADNEPLHTGIDPLELKKNARVEVLMLNERVADLEGPAEP